MTESSRIEHDRPMLNDTCDDPAIEAGGGVRRFSFGKGPLITVLKDTHHYSSYRALVIDIGAFTTDFAAVSLKADGETVTNPDAKFDVKQESVPCAISNLDEQMRSVLKVDEWPNKPNWQEWTTFQRNVYAEGKGYRVPGIGVVGGEKDKDAVQGCIHDFAQRLADEATKFCAALEPAAMQELIFTGGGSNILVVREALQEAAQVNGKSFVKVHAPDIKRIKGGPAIDKLDEQFTRGGSALGGASIYFEREYYD